MAFSPIQASQEITEKYKRYLMTIFKISDPDYEEQFIQELNQSSMLAKGPYLDAVDSFKKGKSPAQLIEEGVLPASFRKLGIPMDRTLYKHQETSIRKVKSGRNTVVSTGTGSGKTESFLLPILAELARESENRTLCPGVRALIIYPMNALANDQMERLRSILDNYPEITFGSYTGQTKRDRRNALNEYRALNNQKEPKKNELISREEMIASPPHILITNYAMLEYLMIRPRENVFFNGPYARYWKFIVMDEAHVYSSTTGIEVSMLLRRLKSSLPVKNIQYILTSATLGSEDQNKEVADFASRLCDNQFYPEDVIRAVRENPKLSRTGAIRRNISIYHKLANEIREDHENGIREEVAQLTGIKRVENLKSAIYDYVIQDQNYRDIRELLVKNPQTVQYIADSLVCTTKEIEDFVTVAAYAYKNETMLLDAKYHLDNIISVSGILKDICCSANPTTEFLKMFNESVKYDKKILIFYLCKTIIMSNNYLPKIFLLNYLLENFVIDDELQNYDSIFTLYIYTLLFNLYSDISKKRENVYRYARQKDWNDEISAQIDLYFNSSESKFVEKNAFIHGYLGMEEDPENTRRDSYEFQAFACIYNFLYKKNEGVYTLGKSGDKDKLNKYITNKYSFSLEHFLLNDSKKCTIKRGDKSVSYPSNINKYIGGLFNFIYVDKAVNGEVLGNLVMPAKVEILTKNGIAFDDLDENKKRIMHDHPIECNYTNMVLNILSSTNSEGKHEFFNDYWEYYKAKDIEGLIYYFKSDYSKDYTLFMQRILNEFASIFKKARIQ